MTEPKERERANAKEKARAKVKAKEKEKGKEKAKKSSQGPVHPRQKAEEDRLQEKRSDLFAGSSCEDPAQMERTAIFGIQNYAKIGRKAHVVTDKLVP